MMGWHAGIAAPAALVASFSLPITQGRCSMAYLHNECPSCQSGHIENLREVEGYRYYICRTCRFIFIHPAILEKIDMGRTIREYNPDYWQMELSAAKERSYSVALARIAEVIYYTKIPIKNFIDIGTGPGYVLDSLRLYLPSHTDRFHGVERFPPPPEFRTNHKNYRIGNLGDLDLCFEAGMCMEVIEHLTPRMLRNLLEEISAKSKPGACFIFNSGLSDYVLNEDPAYLDPIRRGHIVSWSVEAVRAQCDGLDLTVLPIKGKTWAFIVERRDIRLTANVTEDIRNRVWSALPENLEILMDPVMGSVLKILGHHTILAFQ
jgi:hypothetical protein